MKQSPAPVVSTTEATRAAGCQKTRAGEEEEARPLPPPPLLPPSPPSPPHPPPPPPLSTSMLPLPPRFTSTALREAGDLDRSSLAAASTSASLSVLRPPRPSPPPSPPFEELSRERSLASSVSLGLSVWMHPRSSSEMGASTPPASVFARGREQGFCFFGERSRREIEVEGNLKKASETTTRNQPTHRGRLAPPRRQPPARTRR